MDGKGRVGSHSGMSDSDRSSVSGRSSTSKASRGSRRSSKKPPVSTPPPEPVEDPKAPFTPSMLASGLSQLGRTADGRSPAYLTLTLAGTDLGSAEPLAGFPHLQTVRLPDNRLSEVRGLGALRYLTAVDVSGNKLTQVLDLRLGPDGSGPTNLRSADFSRNAVDMLRDLRPFSRLTSLALAHNRIERVGSGLRPLTLLKVLDLSHNRLVSCRGLESLSSLRELRLSHNCLASLEPLAGLAQLQVLIASHNWLQHLAGVSSLSALRTLDVSFNRLGRLEELAAVRGASLLGGLDVRGNPLDKALSLRLHVVHLLPQVVLLDGVPVDSKEKVLAANMHGADAEGLRLIRRKYFPNGELDDGGGAIPPLAAGLVASAAEEEASMDGADASALLRLDAWSASLRPDSLIAPASLSGSWGGAAANGGGAAAATLGAAASGSASGGAALVALADQLASVCVPSGVPTGPAAAAAGNGASSAGAANGGLSRSSSLGGVGSTSMKGTPRPTAPAGPNPQAQLQRARVCWRWVVTHVAPGASLDRTWDVEAPLFGPGAAAAAAERLLLGDGPAPLPRTPLPPAATPSSNSIAAVANGGAGTPRPPPTAPEPAAPGAGTWAERVARLFTLLCRACELDAVPIPGYWKHAKLPPGERVHSHNHCWAGVKVNGRWRLVDPAAAALDGGHWPFFVPPDAWIYSYWPLEAAWQLLPDPLGQEVWWALPSASVAFFARGCALGSAELAAVNELPSVREGGVLPAFQLGMAAPRAPGTHLAQRLREAGSRRLVAEWPPREPGAPAYAFQQIVAGQRGSREVAFGADRHLSQLHSMWWSLPGPGEYEAEVSAVRELPGGGLRLSVGGHPLRLRVVEETLLLRVKVVLPPIAPHDVEEDGILHSPAVLRTPLPYASSYFSSAGCQLVSPQPHRPLEADRSEPFNVVVPGAARVGLMAEGLEQPIELPQVPDADGPAVFATSLQVPRAPAATLMAYVHNTALNSCAWVPLVQIRVLPQSQHMVFTPVPGEVAEVDPDDPEAHYAREIFKAMDKDVDGLVTRREILAAFRRNRQHADVLKCPARIRQDDGTFDRFVDIFMQIDSAKLGTFTFNELASYMGVLPSGMYESSEGEYESTDDGEGEEDEGEEAEGGAAAMENGEATA